MELQALRFFVLFGLATVLSAADLGGGHGHGGHENWNYRPCDSLSYLVLLQYSLLLTLEEVMAMVAMRTMLMMIKNTCTLVRRRKRTGQGMFMGITMYSFLMDGFSVLTTMSVATVAILLM